MYVNLFFSINKFKFKYFLIMWLESGKTPTNGYGSASEWKCLLLCKWQDSRGLYTSVCGHINGQTDVVPPVNRAPLAAPHNWQK